jgi:hypothetical protein
MKAEPIWTPSANVGFATCHVLGSWVIGLVCWLIGWPEWVPLAATVGFATAKEYGFDWLIERDELGWGGSLSDFAGYMGGMIALAALRWVVTC